VAWLARSLCAVARLRETTTDLEVKKRWVKRRWVKRSHLQEGRTSTAKTAHGEAERRGR
jgi:hypothetical protein